MKISLCIPQYNRIQFLLRNLSILEEQSYDNIEVVISDDASTDDTEQKISGIAGKYKYPLVYHRHPKNVGYDANLRKSLELASGDYCFILGNDDTIVGADSIRDLVDFLEKEGRPELGFCNYIEDTDEKKVIERAFCSNVIGSSVETALKYYRSFSFVAGIIIKKSTFEEVDTSKADGTVYVQMYFAARIIAAGGRLFMYNKPLVLKDIRIDGSMANSYRDTLMKSWKEFKPIDGGLKQVVWATVEGFRDAGVQTRDISYKVLKNIFNFTVPFWLIDYRSNGSFVGAAAMAKGVKPSGFRDFQELGGFQKIKIKFYYYCSVAIGFLVPVFVFKKLKPAIYRYIKK